MLTQRLFFICTLSVFASACTQDLFHLREPAPVYENPPVVYEDFPATEPQPEPALENSDTKIEIKPIEETATIPVPIELTPEPVPLEPTLGLLTPEQEKELADLEKGALTDLGNTGTSTPPSPTQSEELGKSTPVTITPPEQSATAVVPNGQGTQPAQPFSALGQNPTTPQPPISQPVVETPPPPPPAPPPPPPFEPLQTFAPLSPVVGTLVLAANKSSDKGNVESASMTIERAIRIEPKNPTLFYKLALLRLKQAKPKLAEDLAKKSLQLAANDKQLKKHSWLLIARARDMQNNPEGAKEARKKAEKF